MVGNLVRFCVAFGGVWGLFCFFFFLFSFLLSFLLPFKGRRKNLDHIKLIQYAKSLGGRVVWRGDSSSPRGIGIENILFCPPLTRG